VILYTFILIIIRLFIESAINMLTSFAYPSALFGSFPSMASTRPAARERLQHPAVAEPTVSSHRSLHARSGMHLPYSKTKQLIQALNQGYQKALENQQGLFNTLQQKLYWKESMRSLFSVIKHVPHEQNVLTKSRFYPEASPEHPPSLRMTIVRTRYRENSLFKVDIRESLQEIRQQMRLRDRYSESFCDTSSLEYDDSIIEDTRAFSPMEEQLRQHFIYRPVAAEPFLKIQGSYNGHTSIKVKPNDDAEKSA
jgi:hypothetical protein